MTEEFLREGVTAMYYRRLGQGNRESKSLALDICTYYLSFECSGIGGTAHAMGALRKKEGEMGEGVRLSWTTSVWMYLAECGFGTITCP